MSQNVRILASGQGWRAMDIICTSGAGDRPFEERHGDVCIAAVSQGTFRYRTRQGTAMLTPGGLLLGNAGACFECGHEHGRGDRCLSFHFDPAFFEGVLAGVPGARSIDFTEARLPPLATLAPLLADAEAARDEGDRAALEEAGVRFAGAVATLLCPQGARKAPPGRRDQKRVAEAIRLIEDEAERPIALSELAAATATSPYHFLRIFRDVAGMTPHQYVLRTRLHRAAVRLAQTADPVSAIAYDAGFNDLSTFNRRFRAVMGATPTAWRARRQSGPPAG
ncbi:MAG: helix-turn-helix transcriptional regulator [Rhizobiaceae bacterium]|nr:helix-turn-helix transcriptional regulator [Rhizobiaceae bacterium]